MFRSEYGEWQAELAGERRSNLRRYVIAALIGVALAGLLIAVEKGLIA